MFGAIDHLAQPFFKFDLSQSPNPYKDAGLALKVSHMSKDIPATLAYVMKELKDFSSLIEYTLTPGSPRLQLDHFITACYSLQQHLLSAINPVQNISVSEQRPHQEAAFGIAGLIYMKLILREFHHVTSGSETLINRLKTLLSLVFKIEPMSPPVIWCLYMGGLASKSTWHRTWFVAHLAKVASALDIFPWEEQRAELAKVVWYGKVLDAGGRALRQEVELMRSVLMA